MIDGIGSPFLAGLTSMVDGVKDLVDSLSGLTHGITNFGKEDPEEETTATSTQETPVTNPMQPNNNRMQFS